MHLLIYQILKLIIMLLDFEHQDFLNNEQVEYFRAVSKKLK